MSFSSLLNQIKHKSPVPELETGNHRKSTTGLPTSTPTQEERSYTTRKIDPAVQRLKELRRLENEKKEALKAKAKGTVGKPRSKSAPTTTAKTITIRQKPIPRDQQAQNVKAGPPPKRLTFAELMAEAKDKTKSLNTSKEPSPKPADHGFVSKTQSTQPKQRPIAKRLSRTDPVPSRRKDTSSDYKVSKIRAITNKPKPLAGPSAQLKAKLEAKKRAVPRESKSRRSTHYNKYDEEEELEDDDGFVIDDDEADDVASDDAGYDREEIWKMFNRGKGRSAYADYDDDLSDMEATGSEILREEDLAAKRARREELEELEREKRRIEEKRRRLGKK